MGKNLLYRGRLLVYACMTAIGGVAGSGAGIPLLWLVAPLALVATAIAVGRKRGIRTGFLITCMIFLYCGLYMGYARSCDWRGRGGPAGEVTITGRVEVGCRGEPGGEALLFRVSEVVEGDGARIGDRYLLRLPEDHHDMPRWGDLLRVRGYLFIFQRESGGVGGSLSASQADIIGGTGNPFLRLALCFRDSLRAVTGKHLEGDAAGLVEGIMLGDYRRLQMRDLVALRASGLIHLCAASGLHVGIVLVFLLWLGKKLSLSRRFLIFLQAPLLASYALAVGLTVPVQRAAAVALVASAAFLLGRDFDFLPALGVAMFYLLAGDPAAAGGTSFQLSFAAALGVTLLHRPLRAMLRAGRSKLVALLAATLAAQLAVAPLLLRHFGEVSLMSPLSNILVLPLIPVVMALTLISCILGMIGLPLAGILLRPVSVAAEWILAVAHTMADARWASVSIFPFTAAMMAIYYAALATAFLDAGRWRRIGRIVLAGLIAAAVLFGCLFPLASLGRDGGMRMTFIDVGQGDSMLLESESGAAVLVDGGMEERVLAEDLRARGIAYLDAVVVSHPDIDHIGGLEAALEICGVGLLVHPGTENGGRMGELLGRAEEMGVTVRSMHAGDVMRLGEMTLTALGPPADIPADAETNEYSLVLRVQGPGLSLLLTGDVEEEGEAMLMLNANNLDCEILKVPHHGGFSENNDDLFTMVKPLIAVISVGRDNPYGHPSRTTVDCLREGGCSVYRTDLCGDIVINVVEGGYKVVCER